jgi:hypothetical protein
MPDSVSASPDHPEAASASATCWQATEVTMQASQIRPAVTLLAALALALAIVVASLASAPADPAPPPSPPLRLGTSVGHATPE